MVSFCGIRAWYCNVVYDIKNIPFRIKHGVSKRKLWDLDSTIAKFIAPRVSAFRDYTHCCPRDIRYEEWMFILGEIAWVFSTYDDEDMREMWPRRREIALEYFAKYFKYLWD